MRKEIRFGTGLTISIDYQNHAKAGAAAEQAREQDRKALLQEAADPSSEAGRHSSS